MIKYNLKELIIKKEFIEKRAITITEIAKELDISKNTLYRIANSKGNFSTKTEYIEKLCKYFNCTPNDFMSFIPDPPAPQKHETAKA